MHSLSVTGHTTAMGSIDLVSAKKALEQSNLTRNEKWSAEGEPPRVLYYLHSCHDINDFVTP